MPLPTKRKRKAPDIISGVPFNEREAVNLLMVSKQKQRITVMLTEISVPITSLFQTDEETGSLPPPPPPPPHAEDYGDGIYSDTEELDTSTAQKTDRKGPSRSVSVSTFFFQRPGIPV